MDLAPAYPWEVALAKEDVKTLVRDVQDQAREEAMHAQVTLTVDESKALIARAIASLPRVRRAAENSLVVLHPSSSTWPIVQYLIGAPPRARVAVCGMIVPKGTCISLEASKPYEHCASSEHATGPATFPHSWGVRKGEFSTGVPLGELIKSMGPQDIYIKGVNAIDPTGKVGVLIGSRIEGGTIGLVLQHAEEQGFEVIYPCGLEKLIPWDIADAARAVSKQEDCIYSMGMRVALKECPGTVVTELEAIKLLSGARAIPLASGGLQGAEGAKTFLVSGTRTEAQQALSLVLECKGVKLPSPVPLSCSSTTRPELCATCSLWAESGMPEPLHPFYP